MTNTVLLLIMGFFAGWGFADFVETIFKAVMKVKK